MSSGQADTNYSLVESYFMDDGQECADCEFCKSWTEVLGEYMGQPARQSFSECILLESGKTDQCPALPDLVRKAQEMTE